MGLDYESFGLTAVFSSHSVKPIGAQAHPFCSGVLEVPVASLGSPVASVL